MAEHIFRDEDGVALKLSDCDDKIPGHVQAETEGGPVCLTPGQLLGVAQAAHELTGRPVPVILDRPQVNPLVTHMISGFPIMLDLDENVRINNEPLSPRLARYFAAHIAAYADAAEQDTVDLQQAKALAGYLAAAHRGCAEDHLSDAITALRWMRKQEKTCSDLRWVTAITDVPLVFGLEEMMQAASRNDFYSELPGG